MEKINMTIGRFQPFTRGHLNMINEGEGPCIVYRINSSNKTIERKKKGIKIGSKSWTNESVNKIIDYIDNPIGDLTEQEKELLKRPFTNELIDKELESVKKSNKNIVDVIPVINMFDALIQFNKFITDNADKYEPQYLMCGDDRVESYAENIDKYDELDDAWQSNKKIPNLLKGKLKVNTGSGRTDGVSGTAVRKAILNKDKAAFTKIMPNGADTMFDDFVKAFDDFKVQLQNIVKEHHMMTLKEYIFESIDNKYKKELDALLKEKNLNADSTIYSVWRNLSKKEIYIFKTDSYLNLLELWKKSKLYPNENGRYLSFQLTEESALHVCDSKPFKNLKVINKTK